MMLRSYLRLLRERHLEDLQIYRARHSDPRNRAIHWVMIPVETFSFLLLIFASVEALLRHRRRGEQREDHQNPSKSEAAVKADTANPNASSIDDSSSLFLLSIGWCVGLVSALIATEDNRSIGLASLAFHVIACRVALRLVTGRSNRHQFDASPPSSTMFGPAAKHSPIVLAFFLWTISWSLQVVVGHWGFEGNQPNVANIDEVSWLAMTQSVLIAWSS